AGKVSELDPNDGADDVADLAQPRAQPNFRRGGLGIVEDSYQPFAITRIAPDSQLVRRPADHLLALVPEHPEELLVDGHDPTGRRLADARRDRAVLKGERESL